MFLTGGNSNRIMRNIRPVTFRPNRVSVVGRDEVRPLEITEVRKQEDGQLNVSAREVM